MTPIDLPRPVTTALEQASRPLLELAHRICALESTFVTAIDWDAQTQEILVAFNSGPLRMLEGSKIAWGDSLSRQLLLLGRSHCSAIGTELAATSMSIAMGIRSFAALPILYGDEMIGMVCGASQKSIELNESQAEAMQLIADALQQLLDARREMGACEQRAVDAEKGMEHAQQEAELHAADSRKMKQLAHTDSLTGLPNRRAFMARWEDELARSGRRLHPIGLMFIDVDRFKAVNDTLGHGTGDAVLRGIGAALRQLANSDDVVARLGGDEFALATMHKSPVQMAQLASAIQARFAIVAAELGVDSSLSIGIAHSDSFPRDQLLVEADRAMYRSKFGQGVAA